MAEGTATTAPAAGERTAPDVPTRADLDERLGRHRPELAHHCRRMLGSAFEAEDAVQETLVRAWRGFDRFEGRSGLRSWLYSIATNVCLDMLNRGRRRPVPVDHTAAARDETPAGPEDDPAERVVSRESVRAALLATLLHLPPRQRAVLILREVLRWRASEVAELLGTSVTSVNSALQRARWTIAATSAATSGATGGAAAGAAVGATDDRGWPLNQGQERLLSRYVDAFERKDLDSLVSLLT